MGENPDIVALSADLIFAARIRSAGESVDVNTYLARNVDDFLKHVRDDQPRLAVLDMDRRGIDVRDVVLQVKAAGVEVLCYVSHVREDLIAVAREAGADRVMARGAFAKQLAELLRAQR